MRSTKSSRIACLFAALISPVALAQMNPAPLVSQPLVPDTAAPGGAGFSLTVNGAGFVPGAVVNWNGSARTTTFASGSQLTALIPSSDVATAGTASISVANPGAGAASNIVFFPITESTSTVSLAREDYSFGLGALGEGAQGAVAADFNGDGKLDLAMSGFESSEIYVLLGNGDGTFGAPVGYGPVGESYPTIGDFNGDGKPDLAVLTPNAGGGVVSVFLGNGDGTFGAEINSPFSGSDNGLIATGDFNGDGKLDLALTSTIDVASSGMVEVLLGNGDGTFQPPQIYPTTRGVRPICVGDFNGDGKLDLAVGGWNASSQGILLIYLGNGDGTFQSPVSTVIQPPSAMIAADFNGDGKLDVAASTNVPAGANVSGAMILLGNGDGTFQAPTIFATGLEPGFLAQGDFNGDGHLDLVTANQSANTVSLLVGNGDGSFQTNADFSVGDLPTGVAVGDFTGDGRLDLAVSNFESEFYTVLTQTVTFPPLNFGNQAVGTTSPPQVTTVTNVLNTTVGVPTINITGANSGDFTQTNNCGSPLPPGGKCNISVQFTPSATGGRAASVSVADDAPGSPQLATLSGVGTTPFVTITGSPQQPLTINGQGNFMAVVTITNGGNVTISSAQVTISGTTLGSASLLSAPLPITNLAPGASTQVTLTFPSTAVKSGATSAPLKVGGSYSVKSPSLNGNWALSFRSVSL